MLDIRFPTLLMLDLFRHLDLRLLHLEVLARLVLLCGRRVFEEQGRIWPLPPAGFPTGRWPVFVPAIEPKLILAQIAVSIAIAEA